MITPDGHTQVTPIPLGAEIERERFGESDHGVLAGHVGKAVEAVREQAGRRCGVDDVTPPLLEEEGEEHEVAAGDAEQVEVEHALPGFDRERFGRAHGEHADVVDDDVDPAESIEARSRSASRSSCSRDVDPRCDCVAAGGQDEVGRLLGPVRIEVADRDTGASVGQSEGGGAADAAAGRR